jgi:predicted  nucleic acid-binding Zn-ribbon protein
MEESLLNFCYITGAFYQYVQISGENFDLMKKNNINEIKIGQNNAIIEKEFESKNNNNYMDYFENLSLLNDNEKKSTKIKSELIRKIFGNEFEKCQNLKKFDILKNKINSSMLKDKFLLVKLISNQIINFLFDIYENFFNVVKNMDEAQNKRYQDLVAKNLIDEEKLINSKKALSKEIIELKKLIDEKNKHINKYKIMEEKLLEINKNQDKEISKLKDSIKMILKNLNDQKIEFEEEVKLLKKELNESKSSISQLENKLIDSDEKVSQLENKLKDSEKTITFIEKKLNYSEKNSEKKITLLNIELGIANGKQLELVNDIKKLKDCIIKLNEKIDKKEEEYNFMKNLNLQIIIDYVSSKNENPQNNQSAITNNGLLRCLNLISKDYELIKSKLDEKNEQLENIKKMFKKNK